MVNLVLLASLLASPVRVVPGPDPAEVRVVARMAISSPDGKLSQKDGERYLRFVLVSGTGDASGPAMFGTYEQHAGTITFTPRFRLTPGERYRATLSTAAGSVWIEYRVPALPPAKPPSVAAVYPSADEVPANLLKFYLHFSRPMREGPGVFDLIKIVGDDGEAVEDPWRRTELWNEDSTRLTLWIHPGRVKEGVNLRDELGPVLESNRRYTLVVSAKFADAEGRPLGTAFTKTFRTTAAVRAAVEVKDWKVSAPEAGTVTPLEVRFPRPLDHALLGRSLTVLNPNGEAVPGRVTLGSDERVWSFVPDRPWAKGAFTLTADDRLEDLAGNTILRPFDLNLKLPPTKDPPRTLPFRVGP